MAPQIKLTQPAAGTTVSYPINTPNMQLGLGFQPDPNAVQKVGQNLEFDFEDGGKIVLEGYYDHFTAKTLPVMVMDDGTELPGEQFLASLREDLLTAAGPSAGPSAASSGMNAYADDAGSLVNGVDRLGSLGTDQWGRDTEVPEAVITDNEVPGGTIGLSIGSGDGAGIYEDWKPQQHLYGDNAPDVPARLNFSFTPTGTTVVTSVVLTGFDVGSKIYIGGPEGAFIEITTAGQQVTLTYGQLGQGVYVQAPANSDHDMNIHAEVTMRATSSGQYRTEGYDFIIVTDAVADLPTDVVGAVTGVNNGEHALSQTVTNESKFEDGYNKTQYSVTTASPDEGRITVSFSVTATFQDFDGSEQHYVLVEQQPGFTGPYTIVEVDGVSYFQIPVSNADLAANNGTLTVPVALQTSQTTGDTTFSVRVGAMAEETPTDGELRTDNNVAYNFDQETADFSVDVINSRLTITAGWASEGNNDAKYAGDSSDAYAYNGPEKDATDTNLDQSNNGAPITLNLSGGQGSTELIESVTFTYDGARGNLEYSGPGTVTQSVAPDGTVTYTITGVNADNLTGLTFKPADTGPQSYNDDDVALNYTVTVVNGAGASATFSGSSTVVIDAVADQGTMGAGSVDYADPSHTAAEAGAVVGVNGSVSFPDTDGSELHYAVIAIPDIAWSIAGLDHDHLLSKDAINAFWRDKGGMPADGADAAVDAALNGILTSGNAGSADNQYLLIEVDPATGTVAVYARDAGGNMVEVNIPGLQVSYANGTLTYTVPVQTPSDIAADTSMDVSSQGVALEKNPGDGEYDYANNIAVTSDTETVNVVVDVITGYLTVSMTMHEDASPNQNQVVAGGDPATGAKDTVTHDAGYGPDGMPITMSLDGGSDSEYVKTITIGTLPGTEQGVIYYNGVAVTAGQVIDTPDLTKFTFKPAENYSGDVDFNFSAVIASHATSASLPAQDLTVPLHVDSVADLADASSNATGRTEAGNEVLTAEDARFEQGWAKQEAGHEQSVDATFTINAKFGDLDGSEKAWIDIELPAGYSIPAGSSYQPVNVGGVNYARVAVDLAADVDANGYYTKDITLSMGNTATDKNLSIKVVTQEQDALNSDGHSTANNTAERVIEQAINIDHLDGTLKVNVGWVYEDNNGGKFGGTAAGPGAGFDAAAAPGANGAPINVAFTPEGSEQLQFVEFTYDASKGTLFYNGAPIDTSGNMPITVAANQLGKLTFKPAEGYSDSDIQLSYKVTIKDGGTTFVVNGETSVVVDAVADKATVTAKEVDYAGSQTAHTGAAGETIDLVIKATFKDTGDGSEKHYILVENPGTGWSCAGATTITVYCDASGNPLQPNGVDGSGNFTYASYANPKEYFQIDVTGNYSANGEYRVTLTPPAYTQDTTLTIKTGTLVEETTVSSDANREYDYSNNQAYDLGSVSVKFNPVDGTITSAVTVAYEDHMPDAHTGNMTNPGNDGRITLTIASGQETVDAGAADAVVLTFKFAGDAPGTFTFNGVNYTATSLGNGEWQLKLPGSAVGSNQTQVQLRYNPPANDDTDLTDIKFDVKVVATGSGATGTLSGTTGTLIVDAVADKPTDVKSSTSDAMDSFKPGDVSNYVDPTINKGSSWSAGTGLETSTYAPTYAAKSFQFTIKAEATFADVDGSETHYLLVQRLSTSWSVDQSSLPTGVTLVGTYTHTDGTVYFKFQVSDSLLDPNGKIAADITLNTPNITGDASYTIKTGGMAVEEHPSDTEARTDNNTAVTIGTGTTVTVDAVQSTLTVKTGWAPEDNNAAQHLPDGSAYNATPGSLGSGYAPVPANYGFGTGNAALINLSLSQGAQDHFTKIVFTFDASSGEFIYNQSSTLYSVAFDTVGGKTTVTVTYNANASGNYTTSSDNFYFRPSGNNSDADINLAYKVTVEGRDDNQITYEGSSPITVDAVADRPTDLRLDATGDYVDGAAGQTAAKPGENVKLTVENVQFHDYKDGSELHYIVVNKNLTNVSGQNIDTLSLAKQTIIVNGTGPNGEHFTQTVVLGLNAASSSITIEGPDGVISTRPMTAAEFTGMTSADGYSNFKIPVLNEFLQLTADGTVSTSVDIIAPNAASDTHYQATVGGYAQETNTNSNANHEVDVNNNNSLNTGKIDFDVKPVTSIPEIAINFDSSKIYENLTPDAHKGIYTESEGAKIQVGGIDAGETATITLTFESKTGVDFTSTDPADVMRIEYNGASYPVTQGPDGKWTVTINVEGSANAIDGELVFKPGHNYNSSDINVSYDVTVTDISSGQEKTWNNTTPGSDGYQDNNLGIVVDAVAQIPVMGDFAADYSATGGSSAFVRGADIVLKTSVTFQDFEDGSERHFLLVEAKPGWDAPDKIVIVDGNGVSHEVPVTYTMQFYGGDMYYRVEIPNSYIQQYGTDGKLDLQIWIDSPSDATNTSFKVGAVAWEDVTHADHEIRSDNNTAFVIGGSVPIAFDQAGSLTLHPQGGVYENDTPNAHKGDDTLAGGTRITITHDADDNVTDFQFTNYDTGKGTLYYLPDGANVGAGYEIPANGFVGVIKDGWSFVFVPAHNYSDADVKLNFTATVTNANSGDVKNIGSGVTIIVDAVAQLPTEATPDPNVFDVTHGTKTAEGADNTRTVTLKVTAAFSDFDGSEQHFVLVEAKANMAVVDSNGNAYDVYYGPNGTTYYKIPVANSAIDPVTGKVTVEVDMVIISRMLGLGHDQDTLSVGALSQETVLSGGESTYHNNVAFMEDGSITINHTWPGGTVIWVDPAYENNTPHANLDDPDQPGIQPDETPSTGGKITFGSVGGETITSVELTWDPAAGGVWVNGVLHASGPLTVSGADLDNMYFVPNHNYSDADTTLGYTVHGAGGATTSGTFPIIVDAVAQMPENLTHDVDYGTGHTAAGVADGHGNEGIVTVKIGGTFPDNDGSEKHYALVEKQPGFDLLTSHDEVYLDGKVYYRVEIPAGQSDVDIQVKLNTTSDYTLKTGIMSEETNPGSIGNLEADRSNNVAWNLDGSVTIEVSPVDTTVSVHINNMAEMGPTDVAVPVAVNWTMGDSDKINYIEFTYDPAKGTVAYTGSGTPTIIDNGNGTFTLRLDNPTDADKSQFTFRPADYSDADTKITWKVEAEDSRSGDVKTSGETVTVIIDAVAQKPVIADHEFTSADGHEAALSGGKAVASVELTFADRDGSETHYAVLEQDGIWKCDQVEINGQPYNVTTVFSQNGTPYYAVEITNAMLAVSDPVKVNFILNAPNSATDTSSSLHIGGIAIETTTGTGGDKELSLSNNWAENLESVDVKIGVVGTTDIGLTVSGLTEDDPNGAAITLNTAQLATNNEKVGDVALTFEGGFGSAQSGSVVGTVIYDGKAYAVTIGADGKAHVSIDFGPSGYDAAKDFRVVWGTVQTDGSGNVVWEGGVPGGTPVVTGFNHTGGDMTVTSEATVVDKASGAEKTITSDSDVAFTPAADAPTGITVVDPSSAVGSNSSVTFTVSASFVDVDGSEQHFILVEKPAGWSGSYSVTNIGGIDYFKVPVSATDPNPSVNIILTTPNGITTDQTATLIVGGMAVDGSDTKTTFEGDTVSVDIGVVNATGVALAMQTMAEDGYTQMQFNLVGGNNDVITGLKFTNLNGGSIVDSTGAPVSLSSPLTAEQVAKALAGDYYFKPAANVSGNVSVGFEATVKDDASGASKSFTGQAGSVSITPVTDIPVDADGTVTGPTDQVGHVASVVVTLSADFIDNTGSEEHFFLVKLPAGVTPPNGWTAVTDPALLSASEMTGTVYKVAADASGTGSFTVSVPEHFVPGDITFKAGSSETALVPPVYQFSDMGTESIGATGTINFDPDAQNAAGTLADALRHPNVPVTGQVSMTDADGDAVTVAALQHNGTNATVDGQNLVVGGTYGTLTINMMTGAYSYELNAGVTPPHGSTENFSYTVSDGHGGTDSATIAITVNAPNADPTAANQNGAIGGVNEDALAPLSGTFLMSDTDGDSVTVSGVSLNGAHASWNDTAQRFELAGQYGTLHIAKDGAYTYTLTNEHIQGAENFVVSFGDQYGGTGNSTLTVNVDYINHAPEAQSATVTFPSGYGFITGDIAFSDSDVNAGHQVNPLVTHVTVGHDTYDVAATGWTEITGEYGVLKVMSDGSYMYTPHDPTTATTLNEWDSFTFKVTDAGGMSDTAHLDIALGTPLTPASLSSFAAASVLGADAHDVFGSGDYANAHLLGHTLDGGHGSDAGGSDLLTDGHGDGMFFGGLGSDILHGSSGNDVFKWTVDDMPESGQTFKDVIKDFTWSDNGGQDTIDLSGLGLTDRNDLSISCTTDGHLEMSFTAPTTGGTQIIVIENVACTDNTAAEQMIADMIVAQQIKLVTS